MASTRLRRTFNYPADSEDEDAVEEGMDEKDQETLLNTLSTKDTTNTRLYTQLLLALPILPALLYIPQLFSISTVLPSILAIASLLASAYTLYYLPLPPVQIKVTSIGDLKDEERDRDRRASGTGTKAKRRAIARSATGFSSAPPPRHTLPPVPYISEETTNLLGKYIVPANAVVCALFVVYEVWLRRDWSHGMMVGGGYVPGFVGAVVLWARRELRVVDLGELERLRYRGKAS